MLNNQLTAISPDDFKFLVKNGKRTSKLFNFDFESVIYFKWGFLKETLPELFAKNDFETLFFLMLKDRGQHWFRNDIQQIKVGTAISVILWLIDELKSIQELEATYLSSSPDIKDVQAGIHKLDQFGNKNTLFNLGGKDFEQHERIRNTPYNEVFDLQFHCVITTEIAKKRATIK
jgi:hypothetical protein